MTSAPLPQPPTASAATAKRAPAEEDAQNEPVDFGDAPRVELSVAEAAAAAPAASSSGYWWLGALALAGLTSAGLVVARRYRSKEWDIIEDNG